MRARGSAVVALALALAPLGAAPRLVVEADDLRVGAVVRAEVVADEALPSPLRLVGELWGGGSRLLFEGLPSRTARRMEVAFWADPAIRSVTVESPATANGFAPPLLLSDGVSPDLPLLGAVTGTLGRPPAYFDARGEDREALALRARTELFLSPAPRASLLALGFALAAAAALTLMRRPRLRAALTAGVSALGLAAALLLLPPRAEFFVVHVPGGTPEARLQGRLELRTDAIAGVARREWGIPGGAAFFTFRSAAPPSLPLGLLFDGRGRYSFSSPPVFRPEAGTFRADFAGSVAGWWLDE